MTVALTVLLTVLAFAFVAYPFFRRKPPSVQSFGDDRLQALLSRRNTAYSMLQELEFDFQSGILAEDEYRDLEATYKGEAISILKEIDHLPTDTERDDEIEKQVLELRQSKGQFCTQCGARHEESDLFCSQCGMNLSEEE